MTKDFHAVILQKIGVRISFFVLSFLAIHLNAQEVVGSGEEHFFDHLALIGEVDRPTLNYRTLSDNDWNGPELYRLYGPELFVSFNSTRPYGYNDAALWQGRGINTSLTGGFRINRMGFDLTVKPLIAFSQNSSFDLMPSAYSSEYGYIWGYWLGAGADAPQRFGDEPFGTYSWGDSELRYTWKTLTLGFGTQSPWVGPGKINSIMHSNNAAPYPKVDVGIKRTALNIFSWFAGEVEVRLWAGYLTESEYFDDDSTNDHNLISALSFAYAPSFLPGLTLFANRSYLAPWEAESINSVPSLFFFEFGSGDDDVWDQRASFGFDYLLPSSGIEVYGEIGINDFAPGLDGYIRYPFHSMVYTGGVRKSLKFLKAVGLSGEIVFEWTDLELSQDFQFQWPATFYMHHQILQGYTNGGQWLGAAIGTGGNSQYLGIRLFHRLGQGELFIQRVNPDNDFIYKNSIANGASFDPEDIEDFRADLSIGARTSIRISSPLSVSLGVVLTQIHNPLYESISYRKTEKAYNFRLESGIKYEY